MRFAAETSVALLHLVGVIVAAALGSGLLVAAFVVAGIAL